MLSGALPASASVPMLGTNGYQSITKQWGLFRFKLELYHTFPTIGIKRSFSLGLCLLKNPCDLALDHSDLFGCVDFFPVEISHVKDVDHLIHIGCNF